MEMIHPKIGTAAAVATAVLAGSMITIEPAAALSIGNTLNFTTNDSGGSELVKLLDNSDGTFTFNLGSISINPGTSPVFGSPGTPLAFSPLTLIRTSTSGSTNVFALSGTTPFTWITGGLEDGRVFNLSSFSLTTIGISPTSLSNFTAEFKGFFVPPGESMPGVGGLGGAGQLTGTNGAVGAGAIEVVPTPALLPGLVGMGVAALRRKSEEESTEENA